MPFGLGFSDKNTLFYVKYGKRKEKIYSRCLEMSGKRILLL